MIDEASQRTERLLLVLAGIFIFLSFLILTLLREGGAASFWPFACVVLAAVGLHLGLNRLLPKRDPAILPIVMLMAGWGLALVDRLAPYLLLRQSIWLIISSVGLLCMASLPPDLRILKRYRYLWLILGIILLAATLIVGVNPSGDPYAPRLWLGFGSLYFQPSELLKLLMIIFLASYLAEKRDLIKTAGPRMGNIQLPSLPYLAPMLFMWGFCMVLLVWQRDLGAAFLFFLVFLVMLYLATDQGIYLVIGGTLLAVVALLGYWMYDVVELRFDIFFNPWIDPAGRAYQIVQSLIAVASGGVLGEGIGQGAPLFVPVVHSDFIFAAIVEEWGLLGGFAVIILIAMLFLRGITIAYNRLEKPFHSLLSAGIVISLTIQSVMIVAGVLKVMPLTGVTLPFISYGGSSLLISFMMIGLLLRISDSLSHSKLPKFIQLKREARHE